MWRGRLLLNGELNTGMVQDKVYNDQFARSVNEPGITDVTRKTASEAKKHWSDVMKSGQYFSTYIGHAGPTTYSKYAHLWTSSDVMSTTYPHLPIMTTACCDVARYDGGVQGIVSEEQVQSGEVRIFAPEGFEEHAVSENVFAGRAMARRASYQYGTLIEPGSIGSLCMALRSVTALPDGVPPMKKL